MGDRVFRFGGRPFTTIVEGTAERDDYIFRLEGRAGLRDARQRAEERQEEFATRLLYQLIDADVRYEILAGLLIPQGMGDGDWTPDLAAETAGFLRRLRAPEDKSAIDAQTLALLTDFIGRGIDWSGTTPTASDPVAPRDARPEGIIAMASGAD